MVWLPASACAKADVTPSAALLRLASREGYRLLASRWSRPRAGFCLMAEATGDSAGDYSRPLSNSDRQNRGRFQHAQQKRRAASAHHGAIIPRPSAGRQSAWSAGRRPRISGIGRKPERQPDGGPADQRTADRGLADKSGGVLMRQWLQRRSLLCGAAFVAGPFDSLDRRPRAGRQAAADLRRLRRWKTIQGTTLSRDGQWLAYAMTAQGVDGELIVRNLQSGQEYRHPRGINPQITPDGKFVVFTIAQIEGRRGAAARAGAPRRRPWPGTRR